MMLQVKLEDRAIYLDGFFGDSDEGGIDGPMMRAALDRLGSGDVFAWVNSPGGSVVHGEAVVEALRSHPGHVTTIASGLVASQAVSVYLAGDDRVTVGQVLFMIHGASTVVAGPRVELESALEALKRWDAQSIEYYVERTGLDRATVEAWHNDGRDHWFDAVEAQELGIVHDVRHYEAPPQATTATEERFAKMRRNSAVSDCRERIEAAKRILVESARAKRGPRPAAKAAIIEPRSAPIQRAELSESDLRFDRWRRLQGHLDVEFAQALARNRKLSAITGIELPRPQRIDARRLV